MNEKARKPRSKHSYRDLIREVIRDSLARGQKLSLRAIQDKAGGGSLGTVKEELQKLLSGDKIRASALIGAGAPTLAERMVDLENAIDASLERERVLEADNAALRASLQEARSELDKLLVAHQDSQRLLLQGVDDLRQMVKAGQGGLPAGVMDAERAKSLPPEKTGDAIYWQAKHDQLLQRYIALDGKNRKMAGQLHELGVDVD